MKTELSKEEMLRYSRHLLLPEVGRPGQEKLKAARILVVGCGGLGNPASLYLAAAGVGTIGLADFDSVDLTNLQRQIIYLNEDVGASKVQTAARRLNERNPEIEICVHDGAMSAKNAIQILSDYDLVIDGTDNFATRFLLNDACVLLDKPYIYGSIYRFEGQAAVFSRASGCYRCLFPEPPTGDAVPNCAEAGVLGVLAGIIGSIQAIEALKLVMGIGESLAGRLLTFDALAMQFDELPLERNSSCAVCGDSPTITELREPIVAACATGESMDVEPRDLAKELQADNNVFLLDVRNPDEYELCRLENSILIPLGELPQRVEEVRGAENIVVYCRSGVRSQRAIAILQQAGIAPARNLRGGILAWSDQVDPTIPRY